jgi:hypothetical protein
MISGYSKVAAALLPVCMLLAATCKKADFDGSKKADLNKSFSLSVGEKAIINTDRLLIELSVIDDSRCPANVQCIWAGNAKVKLAVKGTEAEQKRLDLCLGQCDKGFVEADTVSFEQDNKSYSLILTSVTPYPGTEEGKKTATLLLKRK